MQIQPYLFFEGRAEEAIEFYKKALGAKVEVVMRYKDSPEAPRPGMLPAGSENKVMHSAFKVGESTVMASDGMCSGKPNFDGVTLSLNPASEAEAKRLFGALSEGGRVNQPLTKMFFSPAFGMLHDRFGVPWMVVVNAQ
jgi:PhnB protein